MVFYFIIIIFFVYLASNPRVILPSALRLEGKVIMYYTGKHFFNCAYEDKCYGLTRFSDNVDFNYYSSKMFTITKRRE